MNPDVASKDESTVKCPSCSREVTVADPAGPSPGGVVQIKCPHCEKTSEHPNPLGDESYTFSETTWLRPFVEKVDGARARDGSGPAQVRVLGGYELADPGEVGAVEFQPGQAIQRRFAPPELLEEVSK